MEDLIILYSGGADSRLLLEVAKLLNRKPFCILIDYEQLHSEELDFAKEHLEKKNISFQIVRITDLDIESGLTKNGTKNYGNNVHEMHVPGRNLIFISIAASIAESKNIETIWYGADWSDTNNLFPDCMHGWIQQVNKVLEINGPKPIKLEAPLTGLSKENIIVILKSLKIDTSEIYSGYGDL